MRKKILFVNGVLALALALSLAGVLAMISERWWLPQWVLAQPDYVTRVCVSMRFDASGYLRAALWWGNPINPYTGRVRPAIFKSSIACMLGPWWPVLPTVGQLQLAK